MSTNRTRIRRPPKSPRLTPEAIAAWRACDQEALDCALGLKPWERTPLPREITALGVSEDCPPNPDSIYPFDHSWHKAIKLQRELLKVAGWPDCREAYEKNLRDAVEWERYIRECIAHPEFAGQGTGCDPASRRRQLKEAKVDVAYRKRLLAELGREGRDA
jgi:hypothetical protein